MSTQPKPAGRKQGRNTGADPITMQIIKHDLISIPNQIDRNIARTAFSPLINEYKDYAVGIVDAEGSLISQSRGSLLIFAANALGTAVRDGLSLHGEENLRHGDILISNHPDTLGQHLNNVVMYTPIRAAGGRGKIVAFFCVLMHWIDVGGIMVGSCSSTSTTEIFQEGIQFRSVKLMSKGKRCEDMFRMISCNTRFPDMLMGDVEAQIAGCLLGRDMVGRIVDKHGKNSFRTAVLAMWSQAERRMRMAIAAAPRGEFEAESFLDNDGVNFDKVVPIRIRVRLDGESITVDFSGVADQLDGPLNAGRNGGAVAAARIAVKYLFSPNEPLTEGDFAPLKVEIPDGKFLSAGPNAPLGLSGHMIPTVVDTVLRAMAPAFADKVAAAHHGTYGVHVFHGTSPVTKAPFFHLDTAVGGWGGAIDEDGYGPSRSNVHGDTSDVPIEMQEAFYPFRFESYQLRPDSPGPGEHRGGIGIEKRYMITAPCQLTLKIDRTKCAPWGLAGGQNGKTPDVKIYRADGSTLETFKGTHSLFPGERVLIGTGGGGGYGSPWRRDPEHVRRDVMLGYVTRQAAQESYGVVLTSSGEVDLRQTEQCRKERMSQEAADFA